MDTKKELNPGDNFRHEMKQRFEQVIASEVPTEKFYLEMIIHPVVVIKATNEVGGFVTWIKSTSDLRRQMGGRKKVMVKAKFIDNVFSILKWCP